MSEATIDFEVFGALLGACQSEFDMRLDEDGHGYIYNQSLTGPDCTIELCALPGGAPEPWEVSLEEIDVLAVTAVLRMCIKSVPIGQVRLACRVALIALAIYHRLNKLEAQQVAAEPPYDFMHITGGWDFEDETGAELLHL